LICQLPINKAKVLTEQEYAAIAENKIEKGNTITSIETSYKKGCLMLDVPFGERGDDNKWDREILGKINLDDVYNVPGFGLDFNPHITVLYGFDLEKVAPYHIEKLLPENPITFSISDVSYFESPDYDVLKFGIYSPQLIELNKIYRNLPHENSYPDYKPHLTISYLKKGRAEKYIEVFKNFVNISFQSSKLDYSFNNEDGLKTKMHWDVKGYQTVEDSPEDIQKSFDNDEISTQEYFNLLKAKQYEGLQGGEWKTINGAKVYIKGGKVVAGAGGVFEGESESKKSPFKTIGSEKPKEEIKPKNEIKGEIKGLLNDPKLAQSVFGGDNAIYKHSSKNEKLLRSKLSNEEFKNLEAIYDFTKSQHDTKEIRKKYERDNNFKSFVDGLSSQINEPIYRTMFNFDGKNNYQVGGDFDMFSMSSFTKKDRKSVV
jgi:hypothetical protein